MEIGIDSFASIETKDVATGEDRVKAMQDLINRIVLADKVGLDYFGVGEHHKSYQLDSVPSNILSAAAALTKNIRLSSAVTVLSADDPVRVFQQFSTLDLISNGRAEIVAGRGSSIEAYPLFGYNLNDYDALFEEKLDLLLKVRDNEFITWKGKFRAPINNLPVYPRPKQEKIPVWRVVGGSTESFVRAGKLGLPLMVAIIGGDTHRFRPLVDLYRKAGEEAGFKPEELVVGVHSLGYVAETTEQAIEEYAPGHIKMMNKIGRERGWPPMNIDQFMGQLSPFNSLLLGNPQEVAEKLVRHSEALGGVSRFTFQMDVANLSSENDKLLNSIQLIGDKVKPLVAELLKNK
ncbi:LLM class flavin-dependent oxidoreductase [Algoriella sp.]|uniref:LLM class flavin-dependent oxidoreductase n=1 Tax=Algoriella sp. TaxID=1872434 RepID=UPI002FC67E70